MLRPIFIFLFLTLFVTTSFNPKDKAESIDEKVEKLLNRMTLEEKIGQMTQINITKILQDSILANYDSVRFFVIDTNKVIDLVKNYHIGSFLNGRAVAKENWFEFMDQLTRLNMRYSKNHIPIIYGVDHVHGASYLKEGTIFPHNINIASTFDTTFAWNMGEVTVEETAKLGHRWIFAPVLDIGKNKFWGRYYETFGEDPYVAAQFGRAYINGIQKTTIAGPHKVAACGKHFLGYSDPKSGWDRSPAEIPDQALREFFLPPFKAAIQAGVKTIMINSGEINGIPVHANKKILTDLAKKELGFKGFFVTDWMDIIALVKMHYVAENEKEATMIAINAGVDMAMTPLTTDFCRYVKELVLEGKITEERINESVRRILRVKYEIGLFDTPFPDKSVLQQIGTPAHKQKALDAACESIVLLKNDKSILPINSTIKKILVVGTVADKKLSLCGGWTYRFAPRSDYWFPKDMPTMFESIKSEFKNAEVILAAKNEIASKASNADVIIFAAGEETAYAETDGSINDLTISKEQLEIGAEVFKTGKPVVLVLTEGRPRILPDLYDQSTAVIFAGLPGIYGGEAIAAVLSGKVNPSGKMSFTYPYKQGHIVPYNYKRSEYSILRPVEGELKRFALAEFGEGKSYTNFAYSPITISDTIIKGNNSFKVTITVSNTGSRDGKESVLWFITDEVGTITRPVKELVYFEKKMIGAGKSATYTFVINPLEHLSYPDAEGKLILENGYFTISAGNQTKRFKYQK